MKNTLLRDVVRIAREKLPRHPEKDHWIHFSFVIQNNKLIEYGYNHSQPPPIFMGYAQRLEWGGEAKTHAEFAAWKAAKGLLNPSKSFEMVNMRLSKLGILRLSKPCSCCFNFLQSVGCSCVYFSTDCGFARIGM